MGDDNNLIGKQIGQFTVIEEIGRGGMATVYRATQQSINRQVALKVLPRAFLHDPGFYERFVREVEVISKLEHPHIVPIYDYGEHEGMPYIAMRYLAGGSLRKLIEGGDPELRDLVRPISQIAQALDYAHHEGIIHRDLKPGNVLLDERHNAYLSDFGIAKVINSDLTGSSIVGTPTYMSPEQANGDPLDGRSDIYSLGIVIFELITGREPFMAETPIAMILKHLNERVPFLSEFRDNIPDSVDAVIAKATEKKPENRYISAGEMSEAFADAVRSSNANLPLPSTKPLDEFEDTVTQEPIPTPKLGSLASSLPSRADMEGDTITPATNDIKKQSDRWQIGAGADTRTSDDGGMGWIWGVALVIIAALVGLGLWLRPIGASVEVPLPYDGARLVQTSQYVMAVPEAWAPEAGYYDESGLNRPVHHVWRADDASAYATLTMLTLPESQTENAAVRDYLQSYYPAAEYFPIGETQQGDIQLYSFRVDSGQADVFIRVYERQLVVLESYTSDNAPADMLQQLQAMLDTFRLIG